MCEGKKWQISGMIVWGCPISSLRAESARAVGGGRLFDISTRFFYENGHNSGTKSRKIVPKVGNEASLLNQAKIGPLIKIGVVWQKSDFWAKNQDSWQKKLNSDYVLATTGKCCSKKKVPFSKINIRLLRNFLIGSRIEDTKSFTPCPQKWIFGSKMAIFGQILAFLAHFIRCPSKKKCGQVARVVFPLCGYKNFCFLL